MIGRKWTQEELAFLEAFVPTHHADETAEAMTAKFGREFRAEHIRNMVSRRGIPHLGGKGKNMRPLGEEKVYNGDIWVHVRHAKLKDGGWVKKSHIVYEQAHGHPCPDGCQLMFADHDHMNLSPENIVAVPISVVPTIAKLRLDYYNAASLQLCVTIARVHSARYRKEREVRRGAVLRAPEAAT